MTRITFFLAALLFFMCSTEKQRPSVSCLFMGHALQFSGFSDTTGKFYQHHWPKMHTPETFQKNKQENKNVLCGRIVSADMDTMIELWIKWPAGKEISEADILGLKNDTAWTLITKGRKSNYDSKNNKYTGKSFEMLYFNANREYLCDIDPPGYICLNEIEKTGNDIYTGSGIFSCTLHGTDYRPGRMSKGKFRMEFYIGL